MVEDIRQIINTSIDEPIFVQDRCHLNCTSRLWQNLTVRREINIFEELVKRLSIRSMQCKGNRQVVSNRDTSVPVLAESNRCSCFGIDWNQCMSSLECTTYHITVGAQLGLDFELDDVPVPDH